MGLIINFQYMYTVPNIFKLTLKTIKKTNKNKNVLIERTNGS